MNLISDDTGAGPKEGTFEKEKKDITKALQSAMQCVEIMDGVGIDCCSVRVHKFCDYWEVSMWVGEHEITFCD